MKIADVGKLHFFLIPAGHFKTGIHRHKTQVHKTLFQEMEPFAEF